MAKFQESMQDHDTMGSSTNGVTKDPALFNKDGTGIIILAAISKNEQAETFQLY